MDCMRNVVRFHLMLNVFCDHVPRQDHLVWSAAQMLSRRSLPGSERGSFLSILVEASLSHRYSKLHRVSVFHYQCDSTSAIRAQLIRSMCMQTQC